MTKLNRLTDQDRTFGPITYGRTSWNPLRLVLSSEDEEDKESPPNTLTMYAFGWVARICLPRWIKPHRVKHKAKYWDAATIERMGRDWYYETFPKEYGFSLHQGHLILFFGTQTHDSSTTKSWYYDLPWKQWRFIRRSYYDAEDKHYLTEWERPRGFLLRDAYAAEQAALESCPTVQFQFLDYDGECITATTRIEEREWCKGEGWFKWLSLFHKPMVRRVLDLEFSSEVGTEKGSWKGGTIGHSIDMLPGELHEAAFRRYCEQDHQAKSRSFKLKFLHRLK